MRTMTAVAVARRERTRPQLRALPKRAVIYGRQSRTPTGSESLDLQLDACRETAARHGLTIVDEILEPPSTSAFKDRGRQRPRFPELLDLVANGDAEVVIAYKTDRLSRGGGPGWAPLIDAAERAGLDVDHLVLTPSGWLSEFELGVRATMDREESKKTSERLRDMKARHVDDGRPNGGGARAFGYERDGMTIVPHEAAMLHDAARRLRAGESQASICRGWNEAGMLTGTGAQWRVGTLRNMLLTARIAGLRAHQGDVVGDAAWPAIVERATWEQVRAMLTDPARTPVRGGRASLLNGLARCGRCGAKLVVATVNGRPSYRCQKGPGKPGCGGIGIVADPLEQLIVEAVLQRLDSPEFQEALLAAAGQDPAPDPAVTDLEAAEAKSKELAAIWAAGEITKAEWMAARRPVEAAIESARKRLSKRRSTAVLDGVTSIGDLRSAWPDLPPERRRAVLAEIVDQVVIGPARRGLNRFDDERVDVIWHA